MLPVGNLFPGHCTQGQSSFVGARGALMEHTLGTRDLELEIAGADVTSLLWDLDEVEQAVCELALYSHFAESFRDAFACIDNATFFWLEDGRYADCADSVTKTMFHFRATIEEHFSFSETTSLPRVVRRFLGIDHPASDTQLVATYALIQAVQAVEALANWLFDLELSLYDLDVDLIEQLRQTDPQQYLALVTRARRRDSSSEIIAREDFAIFNGEASKILMLASLYQQADFSDGLRNDFAASSFLRSALDKAFAAKASARAQAAGKANRNPGAVKQENSHKLFEEISTAARSQISSNPKISETELVKTIVAQGKASAPTVRKHLRKGGFIPR